MTMAFRGWNQTLGVHETHLSRPQVNNVTRDRCSLNGIKSRRQIHIVSAAAIEHDFAACRNLMFGNGESQDLDIGPFATEIVRSRGEGLSLSSSDHSRPESVSITYTGATGSLI